MSTPPQKTAVDRQQELKEKILRTETEAQDAAEKGIHTSQLVVFRLGTEEYALRIEEIKEVVLTPGITNIPQVPPYIKGVANVRGNILAILDLEERLGIPHEHDQFGKFTLVLDDEQHKIGILVQDVPNTISVSEDNLDDSNPFIQESDIDERAIQALAKIGDRLIILLNIKNILGQEEVLANLS